MFKFEFVGGLARPQASLREGGGTPVGRDGGRPRACNIRFFPDENYMFLLAHSPSPDFVGSSLLEGASENGLSTTNCNLKGTPWGALLCYVVIARTYFTASAISSSTLARMASIISEDFAQRENLISLPKTASISAMTRSLP